MDDYIFEHWVKRKEGICLLVFVQLRAFFKPFGTQQVLLLLFKFFALLFQAQKIRFMFRVFRAKQILQIAFWFQDCWQLLLNDLCVECKGYHVVESSHHYVDLVFIQLQYIWKHYFNELRNKHIESRKEQLTNSGHTHNKWVLVFWLLHVQGNCLANSQDHRGTEFKQRQLTFWFFDFL